MAKPTKIVAHRVSIPGKVSTTAQEWDKIQHRERQAAVSAIESAQNIGQDLGSLTLSRAVDKE